jgi:excisionase family DNA binding protein
MGNLQKERRYITISEVCEICHVSRRTVYNWIKEGFLEVVRTPSGMPRIDSTLILSNRKIQRRIHQKENLNGLQ